MKRWLTAMRAALAPGEVHAWLCTALVLALFLLEFTRPIVQADDAFISYRYALNLAQGHGLVFNPGEYVEGFTNMLWTLLVAAFIRLGVPAPSAGHAMSVAFGAVTLVVLHVYVRRFLPRRLAWMAAIGPVAMLASNDFACWMSTGLETPLFLCLTIAALLAFDLNRPKTTAWLCVLCVLCRPEGGIEAAVVLGAPWLAAVARGPRSRAEWLHISLPPLIFVAAVAVLTAFRLYYYHDYVPNTFHAKVGQAGANLGWVYLEKFLFDGPMLILPGAILAALQLPRLRLPLLFCLVTTVYVVAIGGDVFRYGRFLLPVFAVLLASAIAGAAWAVSRPAPRRAAGMALAAALPVSVLISLYAVVPLPFANRLADFLDRPTLPFPLLAKRAVAEKHFLFGDEKHLVQELAGKILRARPGAKLIACIGIGKFGYYNMQFTLIDMVGLTDRHVAESRREIPGTFIAPGHSRTDSDYVLSRHPDAILVPSKASIGPLRLPAEMDMLNNPRLEQDYIFSKDGDFWIRKQPGNS